LRLFSAERGAPRSRRPADALLLALSVLFLALIGWVSNPQSGFDRRVAVFLVLVPAVLNLLWRVGMGILSFWALFLLAASLVRVRLDVLRDQVLALLGSVGGGFAHLQGGRLARPVAVVVGVGGSGRLLSGYRSGWRRRLSWPSRRT
jgi:hypothetical protein